MLVRTCPGNDSLKGYSLTYLVVTDILSAQITSTQVSSVLPRHRLLAVLTPLQTFSQYTGSVVNASSTASSSSGAASGSGAVSSSGAAGSSEYPQYHVCMTLCLPWNSH